MVEYLNISDVLTARVDYSGGYDTADRRGRSDYGRMLVSPYRLTPLDGRERRVYVMNYGNSGSAYVRMGGRELFLDSDTEHALARMHAAGGTFAEALEAIGGPSEPTVIGASSGFVAYWNGGPSYSPNASAEWFPNLSAAIAEFRDRVSGHSHTVPVIFQEWPDHGGTYDLIRGDRGPWLDTPCVDASEMTLYVATYVDSPFGMPDRDYASHVIEQGPRDGIRVTSWDGGIGRTRYVS